MAHPLLDVFHRDALVAEESRAAVPEESRAAVPEVAKANLPESVVRREPTEVAGCPVRKTEINKNQKKCSTKNTDKIFL